MNAPLRLLLVSLTLATVGLAMPAPARADAPGLQASPLEYIDTLTPGHIKNGYVDVSNPGDGSLAIRTSVRGFRQTGTDGRLEFFDDPELIGGISLGLSSFELGPREAVRVVFHVDPSKLPAGGVYAALFFQTVPPSQSPNSSYVAESARIGTLLELVNGPATPHHGAVAKLDLPFLQLGRGLTGTLQYQNTDRTAHPVGYRPALTLSVLPWAAHPKLATGLVLPSATREFAIERPGSFFGLLPVTITDTDTHQTTTRWVLVCTAWCQWLLLVIATALTLGVARKIGPSRRSTLK
ncbi:MAG TPA: hypothetical protein VMT30_06535 [Candidatus Saccharimonadia bacterium]|nr:hypothetical protein [Candidatus Saccharimonadia bacterium]